MEGRPTISRTPPEAGGAHSRIDQNAVYTQCHYRCLVSVRSPAPIWRPASGPLLIGSSWPQYRRCLPPVIYGRWIRYYFADWCGEVQMGQQIAAAAGWSNYPRGRFRLFKIPFSSIDQSISQLMNQHIQTLQFCSFVFFFVWSLIKYIFFH